MKNLIKNFLNKLDPKKLGLKLPLEIRSIKEIGIGESNANYLVEINDKKFNFRIHLEKNTLDKPQREFKLLGSIEHLKIAPKAYFYDISLKNFSNSFVILEFIEGKPFSQDYHFSSAQFKELAKELAKLHSISTIKINLPKNKMSFTGYMKRFNSDIKYIQKHSQEKNNIVVLNNIKKQLIEEIQKSHLSNEYCITHGDLAPQNIIQVDKKLKFIDWESSGIGDPAAEIASVIDEISFPITTQEKIIFIKEYNKLRKDKNFRKRIELFIKLIRFEQVLWSIKRLYEIKNKELDVKYLKNKDISEILDYLNYSIKKLEKIDGNIAKFVYEL